MMSSVAPQPLKVDASENDPDLQAKQQAGLLALAARTLALPLGRGAAALGTLRALPGEPLRPPPLCLSGLASEAPRCVVALDLANATAAPGAGAAAELTAWPEFHNGVASALSLATVSPAASGGGGAAGGVFGRAWVDVARQDGPSYAQAGLLMALGLRGQLEQLTWTDLYRHLSFQHDATTIAVCLGMAAAKRGTMDATVARMLFLHLPARHPNSFPEIELSPLVQAASLMGTGLLYQGSCHRLMAETLLEEIGRRPGVPPPPGSGARGGAFTGYGWHGAAGAGRPAGAPPAALQGVTHNRRARACVPAAAPEVVDLLRVEQGGLTGGSRLHVSSASVSGAVYLADPTLKL
ncbi:anaphase-promoting complex subunit 1 [Monoraphidium neglectum]|uniref:Anaphase-promoting complex subunit 1 n=1 Tax=Monoraphidium neglectum TaxID=145388 RepID=A0A0D2IY02_9CHLO|nr:anaphase-promoting complex subunit 1 [Monoraphidium neglectum]KIY92807.1 anaphase-promoting complex subunit 1 [Monoraphidium neglectum]|eukprot:XP_013891827.1 anaphase-promoting complex subunit 1 [Monoraphidium neglectum]